MFNVVAGHHEFSSFSLTNNGEILINRIGSSDQGRATDLYQDRFIVMSVAMQTVTILLPYPYSVWNQNS